MRKLLSHWTGSHLAKGIACLILGLECLLLRGSWWPARFEAVFGHHTERRLALGMLFMLAAAILLLPIKCRRFDVPPCPAWQSWLYYIGSVFGACLIASFGFLQAIGSLDVHQAPTGLALSVWGIHRLMAWLGEIWDKRYIDREQAREVLIEAKIGLQADPETKP